jgi:hypothetical protein
MRTLVTARHLAIALTGILIGFTLSGVAYAISAAGFRYSTPQTGYVTIAGGAFTPLDQNVAFFKGGDELVSSTGSCFFAPVNLPQGAKLTELAMWYAKNDASAKSLLVARMSLSTRSTTTISSVGASNTGGGFQSTAAAVTATSVQTVNNKAYAYFLQTCLSNTEEFVSARLTYTYTKAGD